METNGGCACGAIRFTVNEPFIGIGVCHCSDCQKGAGGGPNYAALVPAAAVALLSGDLKVYHTLGNSGADVARAFCGDCGTPLWSSSASLPYLAIKLGALDDASALKPGLHVFADSAPPWHHIPDDLPAFSQARPLPPIAS